MTAAIPAAAAVGARRPMVAIAGNPNTGKTTLFNRLTGSDQQVGNYPGVTVEKHVGHLVLPGGREIELVDVPGTYSLSARSKEEEIAIRSLAGIDGEPQPDLVVVVVDATQLARNLYIALQVLELEVPLVVALNMSDVLAARGAALDATALARELGVPVVPVSALRGTGLDALGEAIERALADPASATPGAPWQIEDERLAQDVRAIEAELPPSWTHGRPARARALATWALLSVDERDELAGIPEGLRRRVAERRARAALEERQPEQDLIRARYAWIDARLARVARTPSGLRSRTERADAVLLNPWLGFPIFAALMGVVFLALFSWAEPAMQVIESAFDALAGAARGALPAGIARDFVTDALIAGVGSVVVFLPQILLLFLFLGVLEDSGYMARVACLMDRAMRSMGLNGRAFVPMLSGYACAVPAILATRTMERQRDRTLTMLVIPLMTCSARLPVYTLIIGALFPVATFFGIASTQALLFAAMYVFSALIALVAAAVLSRTMLRAPAVPLILEMPPYRVPHGPSVVRMMFQKSRAFLTQAGTIILVCTVALWALLSFPKDHEIERRRARVATELEELAAAPPSLVTDARREELSGFAAEYDGAALRHSYAGRLGQRLEPAIEPLGFDWKIGIGLIGAFAAREVFVATMGVVYGVSDGSEESVTLRDRIRAETRADGHPVYTPLVGLSLMIFFALACQCMSTLAVVKRETRSWGWPLFLFAYMTVLAWVASFAVYQGGRLLGFS